MILAKGSLLSFTFDVQLIDHLCCNSCLQMNVRYSLPSVFSSALVLLNNNNNIADIYIASVGVLVQVRK